MYESLTWLTHGLARRGAIHTHVRKASQFPIILILGTNQTLGAASTKDKHRPLSAEKTVLMVHAERGALVRYLGVSSAS